MPEPAELLAIATATRNDALEFAEKGTRSGDVDQFGRRGWRRVQEFPMPRRPRVFAGGAAYHVYCRFAHGATAFADREGAGRFLANRREVVRTGGVAIHTVSRWVTRGAQQGALVPCITISLSC